MVMGRPPKPTEIKRLTGNPGRRPLKEPLTVVRLPGDAVPAVPRGLGKVGRAAWRDLWRAGRMWLHPITDRALLTRLCQAYDEREKLRAILDDLERQLGPMGRYLTTGSMRQTRLNPLVAVLGQVEDRILRYEGLCGFTPSDRSRLGAAEVERESKLDQLLARRAASDD